MPQNESEPANPGPQWAALAMLLGGAIMVGVSFVWANSAPPRSSWTDEQARAYQSASAELHSLSHKYADHVGNKKDAALPQEMQEARAKYDQLRQQLDSARGRPAAIALALQVAGIALAVIGAAMYFATLRQ